VALVLSRGEVEHDLAPADELAEQLAIGQEADRDLDVALLEHAPPRGLERRRLGAERDHVMAVRRRALREPRADEAGPAGHENLHGSPPVDAPPIAVSRSPCGSGSP